MTRLTRRQFGLFASAGAATLALPTYLRAQGKPRVVVIGGGAGGATAARYIAKDSDGAIDVTLIENSETFTTCFFSNLYVGGYRTFESITHSYDGLQQITASPKSPVWPWAWTAPTRWSPWPTARRSPMTGWWFRLVST
jgi:choline dehydrogenase-like flavoprotein